MVLDAVLLALGKSSKLPNEGCTVAILPEMRIGTGDGIQVRNPATGYELWLTGNVDYAVIRYKYELDNKGMFIQHNCWANFLRSDVADRLLGVDNSRDDALAIAQSCFVLIEAKRQDDGESLASSMPEAVGQAIAVAELTGFEYSIWGLHPLFSSLSIVSPRSVFALQMGEHGFFVSSRGRPAVGYTMNQQLVI